MKDITPLKVALCVLFVVSAPLAIWLNAEVVIGNPTPLYVLFGLLGILLYIFGLKSRCWLTIPFCMGMQGNLNFLPIRFSMLELATIGCFSSLLFYYVMGNRKKIILGPAMQRIPIFVLSSVALFHWLKTGSIGLRTFGSDSIGARPIFTILIASLSYFLILYLGKGDSLGLRLVPWLYLGGCSIDFFCQTITFVAPGLATSIYRVYSAVNMEAYFNMMGSDMGGGIVRLGAINQFTIALAVALISTFRPSSWIMPSRIWMPFALAGCLLGSLYGGFRSGVSTLALHVIAACFATMRSLVLVIILLGVVFCIVLAGAHGTLIDLPLPMQRSLSVLPGKWDSRVVSSTEGSNDFRTKILEMYWSDYAMKNMLLGSGWAVPKAIVAEDEKSFWEKVPDTDPNAQIRRFIELRNEHWGWVNAHHTTGLLGLISIAVLILGSFAQTLRRLYKMQLASITPVMVWSFSMLAYQAIVFLFMGSPIRDCLPTIAVLLAVINLTFIPQASHTPFHLPAIRPSLIPPNQNSFAVSQASSPVDS